MELQTLESPLDCKEIKPVNSKGNQFWIFIGRTDAEAESLVLWPPDVKNWLIVKDPDAGKDWRQEQIGTTEDEKVDSITDLVDMSLEAWSVAVHGVEKSQTWLSHWTDPCHHWFPWPWELMNSLSKWNQESDPNNPLNCMVLWWRLGLSWWRSDKESTCQCRRCGFDPWFRKIPWRRKWQPTPVFLPGEFQGQKSLAGYSPWRSQRVR